MNGAAPRFWDLKGRIAKMFPDRPRELPQGKDGLHKPGRAYGMTAGDQSARGIDRADRFFRQLKPIINSRHERFAADRKWTTFSVTAQPHILIRLNL